MTVVTRMGAYFGYLSTQLGLAATFFALVGLIQAIRRSRRWTEDAPLPIGVVLAALVGSSFLLYVLLPPAVGSGAAMTLTFAPLYGLIVIGIGAVSRGVQEPTRRQSVYGALLFALVVGTFFARPALAIRKPIGYRAVVDYLDGQRALAGQRMLVVSDEAGERALVTDVAIRQLHPRPVIVRGSTLLGANRNGSHVVNEISSPPAILQELEDLHVDYILLDSSPDSVRLPYWLVMKDLVESRGDRLEIEYSTTVDRRNGPTRPLALYRLKHGSPGAARPPRGNLSPTVSKP